MKQEDKCKGIFGLWFGHMFESMVVESIPPKNVPKYDGPAGGITEILDTLTHKKYKVVCRRCGKVQK